MIQPAQPLALRHPERIHPALWRGSQLAQAPRNTVSTGFDCLNRELPNQGWPLGTLIELALSQPGIGEIHFLCPALAQLPLERGIALVHPPCIPYFHCWLNWRLDQHRLLWINTQTERDSLWASEQILKNDACSALLCWAPGVRPAALRRLHLAARQSDILVVLLRPQAAANQTSPAPLRLNLKPAPLGLKIVVAKRQGGRCDTPVFITLYPPRPQIAQTAYAPLDQSLPAHTQLGRAFSPLAN